MISNITLNKLRYYTGKKVGDKVEIEKKGLLSQKKIGSIIGEIFHERGTVEDIYSKRLAMKLGKPIVVMKFSVEAGKGKNRDNSLRIVVASRACNPKECYHIALPDQTLLPCSALRSKLKKNNDLSHHILSTS